MSKGRRYIGVDLGAWYGKKTSIAVLKEEKGTLYISEIIREFSEDNTVKCIYHKDEQIDGKFIFNDKLQKKLDDSPKKVLNTNNWSYLTNPDEKNKKLVDFIIKESGSNAIIGFDAPFGIPYYLFNSSEPSKYKEELYSPKDKKNNEIITGELANQYIFDNSARFVYKHTKLKVLAPAGDKIGKMTARMIHIIKHYGGSLGILKVPTDISSQNNIRQTIEVYPTATLYLLNSNTQLNSYKNDNWNGKKDKNDKITIEAQKKRMLNLIEPYIENLDKWEEKIKTDDDYDAIICALTAYWVDQKDGYEKPEDEKKFTNSFIYIPKVK